MARFPWNKCSSFQARSISTVWRIFCSIWQSLIDKNCEFYRKFVKLNLAHKMQFDENSGQFCIIFPTLLECCMKIHKILCQKTIHFHFFTFLGFTTKFIQTEKILLLTQRICCGIAQPHQKKLTFFKPKADFVSIVLTFDPASKCKHLPRKEKNFCVKIKC